MTYFLHSHMAHGVSVSWFDIDGTVYGLNSRKGITDCDGNEIPMVPAKIAIEIMKMNEKLQ